jgi:hypothetical protein
MHVTALLRPALAGGAMALASACVQVPQGASAPESQVASPAASSPEAAARAASSGRISTRQWPNLVIDNKALVAAPGARIFNSNNLMMTPNMVPEGARVSYELDALGQVRVIRVLPANPAPTAPAAPTPGSR